MLDDLDIRGLYIREAQVAMPVSSLHELVGMLRGCKRYEAAAHLQALSGKPRTLDDLLRAADAVRAGWREDGYDC